MDYINQPERIYYLAEKWQNGSITESEKTEFDSWYNDFESSFEINTGESREAIQDRLYYTIAKKGNIHPKRTNKWQRIAAAASIIFILGISGVYFIKSQKTNQAVQTHNHDIAPGSNKATLTLENGEKILLADAKSGTLAKQLNTTVIKTPDGNIVYKTGGHQFPSSTVAYNTVSTPMGGEYHLILADGTNAWLNAGSSIKYPTVFTGKERKVEITGEVYFEVAHNAAKPFRVISSHQIVEVLGTHFNISAYADEPNIRTTLLEGSVRVSGSDHIRTIKPGEQAILDNKGIAVTRANLEEVIAWKNGYFRFNDENIASIMRKLSRWYNIDVIYQGPISGEGFNGKISRYKNISQALKMLEKTRAVHFEIKGRRITVTQ